MCFTLHLFGLIFFLEIVCVLLQKMLILSTCTERLHSWYCTKLDQPNTNWGEHEPHIDEFAVNFPYISFFICICHSLCCKSRPILILHVLRHVFNSKTTQGVEDMNH